MNTPIWKPVLVVAVLALAGLLLWVNPIKYGIDLQGGTTLVYQVDFDPEDRDRTATLNATIDVLKDRVDPQGMRNLIWQAQGRDRIEVQMPLAAEGVRQARQQYVEARTTLLDANLTASQIDAAARSGDAGIVPQDDPRREQLESLIAALREVESARGPYDEAVRAAERAAELLQGLEEDAPAGEREQIEQVIREEEAELETATRRLVEARRRYESVRQQLLEGNLDPQALDNALNLSQSPMTQQALDNLRANLPAGRMTQAEYEALSAMIAQRQTVSHRLVELRLLEQRHPERAEQIRAVAQAHDAYEGVRGPLDDPEDLKRLLRGSGVLEFRIVPQDRAVPNVDDYVEVLMERGPRAGVNQPYRWFRVDERYADTPLEQQEMLENTEAYFASRGFIARNYGGDAYLLLANEHHNSLSQMHEGWRLTGASRTSDDNGFAAVAFSLNTTGAQLFGRMTGAHTGQSMAIVLDGRVMSSPNIRQAITGGRGIITGPRGGFTPAEQEYLVNTFRAGALGATLNPEPISEKTTGAQFGEDNLHSGQRAAIAALILVAGFMAIYYFFWGFVADFALFANVVLILGTMSFLSASFTLPGIAGIVLTIGMAVDANVIIFERIREELERKADLRTAVRLGYDKALSTIVDANITTLITCVVLGYTATAEVRGFAITLGIGVCATLFTSLFATRIIVDMFIDATNIKRIGMLPTVVPALRKLLTPNIDWLGKRYYLMAFSAVLVVAGIVAVVNRGADMFDIEFRGGTQLEFQLADGARLSMGEATTRMAQAAETAGIPELERGNGATLIALGDLVDGAASEFSIATLHTDTSVARDAYRSAFADVLRVEQPVHFRNDDAQTVSAAPIYVVNSSTLGDVIGRPMIEDDVTDFRGGVAIVLEELSPAVTLDEVAQRISRMQLQPGFEHLTYRIPTVVPLTLEASEEGEALYSSVVVLMADEHTNYLEDPEAFYMEGGFAHDMWRLTSTAMVADATFGSVSNFSPQVSETMRQRAIVALVLSMMAVLLYIWFRFGSLRYSFGAIFALAHDVVIALGLVAVASWIYVNAGDLGLVMLSDFKINLALVAAALTIVGYSLNDTIVIFDRIRENRGRLAQATPAIINDSINQTISRTILTSGTTLLALITLYWLGGDGVHGFAFMMIIGVLVGTYSSIGIATSTLLWGYKGPMDAAARRGTLAVQPEAVPNDEPQGTTP